MAELKPCPFCGSVVIEENTNNFGSFVFHFMCCERCSAKTAYYETKKSAIDAWNKRS